MPPPFDPSRLPSPFPPWCGFVAARVDVDTRGLVAPEEAALVSDRAVEKRRKELHAGRAIARMALRQIGCEDPSPILRGQRGEPLWPKGFAGTISHAGDAVIAATAPAERVYGIGLDIEDLEREVSEDVVRLICHPDERAWVHAAGPSWSRRLKAVFSAKESIFKAFYPLGRVNLEFHDARVVRADGGFDAELLRDATTIHRAGHHFRIGLVELESYVFTYLLVERT